MGVSIACARRCRIYQRGGHERYKQKPAVWVCVGHAHRYGWLRPRREMDATKLSATLAYLGNFSVADYYHHGLAVVRINNLLLG